MRNNTRRGVRRAALTSFLFLLAVGCEQDPQAPSQPEREPSQAVSTLALSFTQVSAGATHTCGITGTQVAYCWGDNEAGELGNGTTSSSSRPVRVSGSLKFAQISAGTMYTCGITTTNFAYCWGSNTNGQLGVPFSTPARTPVAVGGGSRKFRQIRAGYVHTCAVTPLNVGFCWGKNRYGELGANSTVSSSTTPLRVAGGLSWNRISAGGHHSCGVTTSSLVYCWGLGSPGTNPRKPALVPGGLKFSLVVAGGGAYNDIQLDEPVVGHTCGVTTDHRGYCWGENDFGELGNLNAHSFEKTPLPIAGDRRWLQVVAGWVHTCGVTTANVAFCWGANGFGQNGNGTTNSSYVPVRVSGNLAFSAITTGPGPELFDITVVGSHSCGLTTTNRVYCWGDNTAGQLGDGTNTRRLTPVAVVGP